MSCSLPNRCLARARRPCFLRFASRRSASHPLHAARPLPTGLAPSASHPLYTANLLHAHLLPPRRLSPPPYAAPSAPNPGCILRQATCRIPHLDAGLVELTSSTLTMEELAAPTLEARTRTCNTDLEELATLLPHLNPSEDKEDRRSMSEIEVSVAYCTRLSILK